MAKLIEVNVPELLEEMKNDEMNMSDVADIYLALPPELREIVDKLIGRAIGKIEDRAFSWMESHKHKRIFRRRILFFTLTVVVGDIQKVLLAFLNNREPPTVEALLEKV